MLIFSGILIALMKDEEKAVEVSVIYLRLHFLDYYMVMYTLNAGGDEGIGIAARKK